MIVESQILFVACVDRRVSVGDNAPVAFTKGWHFMVVLNRSAVSHSWAPYPGFPWVLLCCSSWSLFLLAALGIELRVALAGMA